jgi:LacI family transcriptional regulator
MILTNVLGNGRRKMKKITLEDLARELNISKGTVDRAIHNRPGVSPKTKEKVLKLVEKYDYKPDKVARVLSLKGKRIKIGVVLQDQPNFFWDHVKGGLEAAQSELADFGLELSYRSTGYKRESQAILKKIDELVEEGIDALIIVPVDTEQLKNKIDELDIPVATLNDDLANSKRLFYVGPQLRQSGRVAGELLGKFMQGQGRVVIIQGSVQSFEYKERLHGFLEILDERYQGLNVVGQYTIENVQECQSLVEKMQDIDGLYNLDGASLAAVGKMLREVPQKIFLVGHELSGEVEEQIEQGIVDATISQDPFCQGYFIAKLLFDYLVEGAVPPERMNTRLDIIMRENISRDNIINPYYIA